MRQDGSLIPDPGHHRMIEEAGRAERWRRQDRRPSPVLQRTRIGSAALKPPFCRRRERGHSSCPGIVQDAARHGRQFGEPFSDRCRTGRQSPRSTAHNVPTLDHRSAPSSTGRAGTGERIRGRSQGAPNRSSGEFSNGIPGNKYSDITAKTTAFGQACRPPPEKTPQPFVRYSIFLQHGRDLGPPSNWPNAG